MAAAPYGPSSTLDFFATWFEEHKLPQLKRDLAEDLVDSLSVLTLQEDCERTFWTCEEIIREFIQNRRRKHYPLSHARLVALIHEVAEPLIRSCRLVRHEEFGYGLPP